ncbi:lipoate--protein ligase family protein [Aeoliella mucimassa]|uniref:Octanoyltransferase LipM n=1 Tax=Aeoliella mucimassa TaxID=2527972 RepID=A0A518AIP0_9BACT|nr:hypothetical protein [Aeoliella mucimassa]QDU54609.1 Octanoyltransferase LipM [Aeoliella mucimassa]
MTKCQLIIDPPQAGAWNMAVDEWLLQRASDQGVVTIRFYEWEAPTLSLGYFQSHVDREQHATSQPLPLVRRASGGGALVHHHELTYSLAVPAGHPLARDTQALYDAAHLTLIDALFSNLTAQGVQLSPTSFLRCPESLPRAGGEPFLCFLRRAKGDVLFSKSSQSSVMLPPDTHKVCGSAQRKHRGSVLQHGGVLLSQSPHAPELPGIAQLCESVENGVAITAPLLVEWWLDLLVQRLDFEIEPGTPFSSDEQQAIGEIATTKFADESWTRRR